jgi:vancomycin resistance protein YoaR
LAEIAQETASADEPREAPTPAPEPPPPRAPEPPPSIVWWRRIRPRAWLAVPVLALLIFFAVPWVAASVVGAGRVLGGVTLGGASIAGRARAELAADVARHARVLAARPLAVRLAAQRFEVAPAALSLRVDEQRTIERALAAGREGGLFARTFGYWRRRGTPVDVVPLAVLDRAKLLVELDVWEARALTDRPFSGGIAVSGSSVTELPPKRGRRVAVAAAEKALLAAFAAPAPRDVELPLELAPLPLPADAASGAANAARALLAGPLSLKSSDPVAAVTLTPAELGPALTTERVEQRLQLAFVAERLGALLEPLRRSIEHEPVDAKFVIAPTGEISITPSHPGLRVELERLGAALEAAAKRPDRSAELPLARRPEPALSTEQAQALGVRGLVSSFTTRHPCCEKRVDNIHRIADLLDGKIVRPGETVSLNALVGPRTLKTGFVPAPTIEEGEIVDSIGGGISQFATTFFNALFHGGYDIIERQPHTYWFPRYPMGHEATLSWPKPDVIFRNDTAAGLLIKTVYTGTNITVKLYGDNGGRKVQAHVSGRQNVVPAPLEILPNATVSPDTEKVKEPGSIGWSVIVSRHLTFPDGTKKEEKRRVTYKSRPRRIELHPCRIPEGEKGYTGQPCPIPENEESSEETVAAATAP